MDFATTVISIGALWSIWLFIVYVSSLLWREKGVRKSKIELKKFAVLVPTYNDYVGPAVESCLKANYPKELVNIYIIDDSDDPEIIKKNRVFEGKNVFWLRREERRKGYKAGALNYALDHLKDEDYVLILDADGEVDVNFFKKACEKFENWGIDILQAKWECLSKKHTMLSYYAWIYAGIFHTLFVPVLNFFKSSLLFGNGFVIKRKVLEEIKFNERFVAEDFKLALDAVEKGYKIMFFTDFSVKVTQPRDLRNIDRQFTRWAFGGTQVIFEHILRKKPNPASIVVLSIWTATAVLTPAVLVTTYYIMITLGFLSDLNFITGVYFAGLLPLFVLTTYYFAKDGMDLPLYKKLLAQILCMPLGFFFHMKGVKKYLLDRKITWTPTEKVV